MTTSLNKLAFSVHPNILTRIYNKSFIVYSKREKAFWLTSYFMFDNKSD